jgi:purine-binding chemotaxis protein CheW
VEIGNQLQGLIVDAVTDLVNINASEIQPPPKMSAEPANIYLDGLVPVGERMVNVLSLEKLGGHDSPALAAAA